MWPDPSETPLRDKDFNAHLDCLIETGQYDLNVLPLLDKYQQRVINEVKKSLNRLKKKYGQTT